MTFRRARRRRGRAGRAVDVAVGHARAADRRRWRTRRPPAAPPSPRRRPASRVQVVVAARAGARTAGRRRRPRCRRRPRTRWRPAPAPGRLLLRRDVGVAQVTVARAAAAGGRALGVDGDGVRQRDHAGRGTARPAAAADVASDGASGPARPGSIVTPRSVAVPVTPRGRDASTPTARRAAARSPRPPRPATSRPPGAAPAPCCARSTLRCTWTLACSPTAIAAPGCRRRTVASQDRRPSNGAAPGGAQRVAVVGAVDGDPPEARRARDA